MRWLLPVVLLAACSGASAPPAPQNSPDFASATCADYLGFTEQQQIDAARNALERLRADDNRPPPRDDDVASFAAGITGTCSATPTSTLVHAVVFTYQH